MRVFTKQEVLKRLEDFCKPYTSYAAAAKAIGCTSAQLSVARLDKGPVCPAILDALGITRTPLYVRSDDLPGKYLDGGTSDF